MKNITALRPLLLGLWLLPAQPALATDVVPLDLSDAAEAIGAAVLTADAVPLGELVATREDEDGRLFCIVRLDDSLEAQTSALIVEGLGRAPDGSLRLPEPASVLAARMRLPLGDG